MNHGLFNVIFSMKNITMYRLQAYQSLIISMGCQVDNVNGRIRIRNKYLIPTLDTYVLKWITINSIRCLLCDIFKWIAQLVIVKNNHKAAKSDKHGTVVNFCNKTAMNEYDIYIWNNSGWLGFRFTVKSLESSKVLWPKLIFWFLWRGRRRYRRGRSNAQVREVLWRSSRPANATEIIRLISFIWYSI